MIIESYTEALRQYSNSYPDSPFFQTWVPEAKFISANIDGENFAISREDGDAIYGIALGTSPVVPDTWKNFSIESRGVAAIPEQYKALGEWDCYWSPTIAGELSSKENVSDDVIQKFLETHAPQSSVFPGNKEIEKWITIFEKDELVAVAALCRWESSFLVASSVATHNEYRGKGFGQKVMRDCLIGAHNLGATELSLGVMHANTAAHKLYQSIGFRLMHNFTYCERK